MPKNISNSSGSDSLYNWAILLLVLGGIGYSLYMGWQAMQPSNSDSANVSGLSSTQANTAKQANALPDIQLNYSHQRQGEEIVVDPAQIGKDNPFSR